eukprot:GSA25T00006891001.1
MRHLIWRSVVRFFSEKEIRDIGSQDTSTERLSEHPDFVSLGGKSSYSVAAKEVSFRNEDKVSGGVVGHISTEDEITSTEVTPRGIRIIRSDVGGNLGSSTRRSNKSGVAGGGPLHQQLALIDEKKEPLIPQKPPISSKVVNPYNILNSAAAESTATTFFIEHRKRAAQEQERKERANDVIVIPKLALPGVGGSSSTGCSSTSSRTRSVLTSGTPPNASATPRPPLPLSARSTAPSSSSRFGIGSIHDELLRTRVREKEQEQRGRNYAHWADSDRYRFEYGDFSKLTQTRTTQHGTSSRDHHGHGQHGSKTTSRYNYNKSKISNGKNRAEQQRTVASFGGDAASTARRRSVVPAFEKKANLESQIARIYRPVADPENEDEEGQEEGADLIDPANDAQETQQRLEMEDLRSGEDAIAFFAKHGGNTSKKFVFCVRRTAHQKHMADREREVVGGGVVGGEDHSPATPKKDHKDMEDGQSPGYSEDGYYPSSPELEMSPNKGDEYKGTEMLTLYQGHDRADPLSVTSARTLNQLRSEAVQDPASFYDLVVVPDTAVDARREHFTISARGVVHIQPGQPSEQISLAKWLHQRLLLSVLSPMNLFRNWLRIKMLRTWVQNARYGLYAKARGRLRATLFWTKPLFAGCAAKIHAAVQDLEDKLRLLSISASHVYILDEFVEAQRVQRALAIKQIEETHESITGMLETLARGAVDVCARLAGREIESKFMRQQKLEFRELKRCRKIALRDAVAVFPLCVQMTDVALLASLVRVVNAAASRFEQRLDSGVKMFSVTVSFNPESEDGSTSGLRIRRGSNSGGNEKGLMLLEPGLGEMREMVQQVWRNTLQGLSAAVPSFQAQVYERTKDELPAVALYYDVVVHPQQQQVQGAKKSEEAVEVAEHQVEEGTKKPDKGEEAGEGDPTSADQDPKAENSGAGGDGETGNEDLQAGETKHRSTATIKAIENDKEKASGKQTSGGPVLPKIAGLPSAKAKPSKTYSRVTRTAEAVLSLVGEQKEISTSGSGGGTSNGNKSGNKNTKKKDLPNSQITPRRTPRLVPQKPTGSKLDQAGTRTKAFREAIVAVNGTKGAGNTSAGEAGEATAAAAGAPSPTSQHNKAGGATAASGATGASSATTNGIAATSSASNDSQLQHNSNEGTTSIQQNSQQQNGNVKQFLTQVEVFGTIAQDRAKGLHGASSTDTGTHKRDALNDDPTIGNLKIALATSGSAAASSSTTNNNSLNPASVAASTAPLARTSTTHPTTLAATSISNNHVARTSQQQLAATTRRLHLESVEELCLNRDRSYTRHLRSIEKKIESTFLQAEQYADQTFAQYRRIYDYGIKWNPEATAKNDSHHYFFREMNLMRNFQDDLDRLRPHHVLSFILLDAKVLKAEALMPVPSKVLLVMKDALRLIGRERCRAAVQAFDTANRNLAEDHAAQLTKYMDHMRTLKRVIESIPKLESQKEEVEGIYLFLRSYQKIAMDDQLQLEQLHAKSEELTTRKVQDAVQFVRQHRGKMIEELGSRVQKLEEDCVTITAELGRGLFVNGEAVSIADSVLVDLRALGDRKRQLEERAETCTEWTVLFKWRGYRQIGTLLAATVQPGSPKKDRSLLDDLMNFEESAFGGGGRGLHALDDPEHYDEEGNPIHFDEEGNPITENYAEIAAVNAEIVQRMKLVFADTFRLWDLIESWTSLSQQWQTGAFLHVVLQNIDHVNEKTEDALRTIAELQSAPERTVALEVLEKIDHFVLKWVDDKLPLAKAMAKWNAELPSASAVDHWHRFFSELNLPVGGAGGVTAQMQTVSLQTLEGHGLWRRFDSEDAIESFFSSEKVS